MFFLAVPLAAGIAANFAVHLHDKFTARKDQARKRTGDGAQRSLNVAVIEQRPSVPQTISQRWAALEEPYQVFMQQRFARMLGSKRQEYLLQMAAEGQAMEISPAHRRQNRRIGLALLLSGVTGASVVYSPLLVVQSVENLPLLFDLAHDMHRNLRNSFLLSAGGGYACRGRDVLRLFESSGSVREYDASGGRAEARAGIGRQSPELSEGRMATARKVYGYLEPQPAQRPPALISGAHRTT